MQFSKNFLRRRHTLILLVLAFVAPWYFAWTWNAALGDIGSDGPSYLMMAQHYSPFGTRNPVYQEAATYSRFPPMYPLVLAVMDAADQLGRAHVITTSCFLLALIAFYLFLQQAGMPVQQSSLMVLLFAILPGSWIVGLFIQSEYLYLFFSLLALMMMVKYQVTASREILFAAALATGAAILTRTVGISLLAPLLLVLRRASKSGAAISLSIALFPPLAWQLVHRSHLGYTEAVSSIYGAGGWNVLRRQVETELPALCNGFSGNFALDGFLRPLADTLGLLCIVGTAWRAIKLKPDAVYTLAHLAILLVWPYPEEARRFLWVLVPLLLTQPLFCYDEWHRKLPEAGVPRALTAALAAVILTMALPAVAFTADRYRSAIYCDLPGAGSYLMWYRSDAVAAQRAVATQVLIGNAMHAISQHVPESDCVIATRPDLINYFGRRRSVIPPLNSIPEPYFTAGIQNTGCHYAFGMIGTDSRFPGPLHPLPRLQSNADRVFVSTSAEAVRGSYPVVAALVGLH